jgi:molecular chaperone DnaK
LPASAKDEVNEALSDLRGALGGSDIERIKTAHEKLAQAAQKAGTMLYGTSDAPGPDASGPGAAGAAGAAGAGAPGGEDVVDAEVVDEDDKK